MKRMLFSVGALLASVFFVSSTQAGGGYIITEDGTPSKWDNSADIDYHPEAGVCGPFSNAEMLTKLENDLGNWSDLSDVNLNLNQVSGSITVNVTSANYTTFYVGFDDEGNQYTAGLQDGLNPILFDDDGEIISEVAGEENQFNVLGFANPSGFTADYSEIVDGQAVINCRCLDGNSNGECCSGGRTDCDNPVVFSENETDFTIVHEFGHFLNLDHTQANETLINDGDDANDDDIPTMYPVSVNAAEQITPTRDDIVALASIYPSSSFTSSTCVIRGTLLDSSGSELRCADVQAVTSDTADTVAFVSGGLAPAVDSASGPNADGDTADEGECRSDCGDFTLRLEPGLTYTLQVRAINSTFVGGSGISPCANDQLDGIDSQDLTTISGSTCTAGSAFTFSSAFTTTSTGGSDGSGDSDPDSSSFGCALNTGTQSSRAWAFGLLFLPAAALLILRRRQMLLAFFIAFRRHRT